MVYNPASLGRVSGIIVDAGGAFGVTQALGAATNAPRRFRMTKTLRSGLLGQTTITGISGGVPLTFMAAIPIEAPCYAVRLGFANIYTNDMVIQKAAVVPSDSYGLCPTMMAVQGGSNTSVVPTGGAASSPIYFDNNGADVGTINASGSARGYTVAGDAGNTGGTAEAFTIKWSDFVPCTSIPRADGGTQHLLFIYVTISSNTISSSGGGLSSSAQMWYPYNTDPLANRGRKIYTGVAWTGSADFADNPSGTGWKMTTVHPLFSIQYLTANPGVQVLLNGDSLSASPTNDGYSSPLMRAAYDLSTLQVPVEVASMAWGGTASPVYEVMLRNNVAAIRPSVVAYQPLSRNDGSSAATMQTLLAKAIANADTFRQAYGTAAILNSAGCQPSFRGNATAIAAFQDMRTRMASIAAASGIPLIDAPSVIGRPTEPWMYIDGLSDDNTHPNYQGVELVVPQARDTLKFISGI